jgi:serine/threonine protein kinase
VKRGEDEFQTEVSVVGRIYHMNLVRVRGVCSEQKHRLLVVEYVDNGSLAMILFGNQGLLQWDQRYKIAVGVAKGLAYLHHECYDWIVHCDLKPERLRTYSWTRILSPRSVTLGLQSCYREIKLIQTCQRFVGPEAMLLQNGPPTFP